MRFLTQCRLKDDDNDKKSLKARHFKELLVMDCWDKWKDNHMMHGWVQTAFQVIRDKNYVLLL